MGSHRPLRSAGNRLTVIAVVLALVTGSAHAARGPFASTTPVGPGGYVLDLDIRWPDDAPPAGEWPVVFFAHGAGGDKTSPAGNATRYAHDGYVTLTWTGRDTAVRACVVGIFRIASIGPWRA